MRELYTRYTLDISATPARVFQALVEPEQTRQYLFGCEAITDWRPGSPLHWRGVHQGQPMVFVVGHVVTFEPGRRLTYTTFDPHSGLPDVPANYLEVDCRLSETGAGTRLEWSQGNFALVANGEARFAEASNGGDAVLRALKAVAEGEQR